MGVIQKRSRWCALKEICQGSDTKVPVLSSYPILPSDAIFSWTNTTFYSYTTLLFLHHQIGKCTIPVLQLLVTLPCQGRVLEKDLFAALNRELLFTFLENLLIETQTGIELCSFEMGDIFLLSCVQLIVCFQLQTDLGYPSHSWWLSFC